MHISSGKLVAGLIIATAVLPLMASAQTTDVQSQIQSLLSQIATLQQQIKTLVASSSASAQTWVASTTPPWLPGSEGGQVIPCVPMTRNFGIGSQGDDVRGLQDVLREDPTAGFTASSTGFFGPLTAKALAQFQMHNGIASSTTGFVGALTREFFARKCNDGQPVGAGVPGPMPYPGSASTTMLGGIDRGRVPPPPPSSASTTPPGGHCGGFVQNAPVCSAGYHCQLNIIADTGGACIANSNGGSQGY